MKKALILVVSLSCLGSLTGCVGTLGGTVMGPFLGGASLTNRVFRAGEPQPVKYIASPFTFIAGTAGGPVCGFLLGFRYDLQLIDNNVKTQVYMADVLDPFSSGLWGVTPYNQIHGP